LAGPWALPARRGAPHNIGCLYFAAKGVWTHAVAGLFLALLTGGISRLVYPFFATRIMRTHYLRKGWRPA